MTSSTSTSSISVHLAALGHWSALPELNTPFQLSLEEVEPTWREDLISRGWESGVFEKRDLKGLRAMSSVIFAELSFSPYVDEAVTPPFPSLQLRWARAAAKLLRQLSDQGAGALYFDGALKVYTPDLLAEVDPKDNTTLFHLFVEVWGDEERVATEGMSIFGLPEVVTRGLDPQSPEAQASTFSAAAQLVCDGVRLGDGVHFRSSESFPWFESRWYSDQAEVCQALGADLEDGSADDALSDSLEPINPCGVCALTPVDAEVSEELSRAWIEALDD